MFPDVNIVIVGIERFLMRESIVPAKFTRGVHDTCFHNVLKCDVDISKFYVRPCRVVRLTTMFQRTCKHMTNELMSLAPSTMKVQVVAPPE